MKSRYSVARMLIAAVLLSAGGLAWAQDAYPSRPIRIIVPFPPGGSIDPLARLVGQKLTEAWGQPVIADNRPGGNSIIGSEAVARSKPDGYTLLVASTTHVINPSLLSTPYDAIKDFAPVATLTKNELVLVVNPSVPANSLRDVIDLAKAKPGQLNFASSGSGTSIHLAGELFSHAAGVKMTHIPYKGAAPAIADLIGGQVQLVFQVPIVVMPHVKSGKLRAIAISGERRLAALPQVPTLAESGLPGVEMRIWNGLLAPAGTPSEVVQKLSAEITKVLSAPEVRTLLLSQGNEPFVSTPDQFASLLRSDLAKFAKIVKSANIKLAN